MKLLDRYFSLVYKALYDTTKMIVNEDSDERPVRDSTAVPALAASDRNTPTKKGPAPSATLNAGEYQLLVQFFL